MSTSAAIRKAITEGIRFTHLPLRSQASVIASVYVISGCKEPGQVDMDLFTSAVSERFKWITDKEIVQAFKMNAFGDLPEQVEFYGIITVANLCKVLNQFEEKRNPVKLELEVAATVLEKTEEEKQELIRQWELDIVNTFKNFKSTGILPKDAICSAIWDSLNKRGLIDLPESMRKEYYDDALQEIISARLKSSDINAVRQTKKAVDSGVMTSEIQNEARNRAKRNHLDDTWTSLENLNLLPK